MAVCFTLETLSEQTLGIEPDPNQISVDDYLSSLGDANPGEAAPEQTPIDELFELLSSACNGEFSREDIAEIHDAMNETGLFDMAFDSALARTDFLQRKYNQMNAQDTRNQKRGAKPITHRLKYLLTLIKKA